MSETSRGEPRLLLALGTEQLLLQLYEAASSSNEPDRSGSLIPSAGNRLLTITHPALPNGEINVSWMPVNELRDGGFLVYEFRMVGGVNTGVLRLTTRARDYVNSTPEHQLGNPRGPRVFIVHGHDEQTEWEVKNYLQNRLGLPEPIILHEVPNQSRTLIEKFEQTAADADAAIILLTPDDRFIEEGTDEELRRTRQNVIFELGYFLGLLGRQCRKVILLHKGSIELPSDISAGVLVAGEAIRTELGFR